MIIPLTLASLSFIAIIATFIAGIATPLHICSIVAGAGTIWAGLSIFNKIKLAVELIKAQNTVIADLHKKLGK